MKTIVTITVDVDIKEKAVEIIRRDMHSNLSHEVNQFLKKIVKNGKSN